MVYQINNIGTTNTSFTDDDLAPVRYTNQIINKGSFIYNLLLKVNTSVVIDGFRQWDHDIYLKSLNLFLEKKGIGTLTVNLNKATEVDLSDFTTVTTLVYNLGTDKEAIRYFNRLVFDTPIVLEKDYFHYVSIQISNNQSYNLLLQGNFYYGN